MSEFLTKKQIGMLYSIPYDSPIGLISTTVQRIASEIGERTDEEVYKSILKVGVNIDKEKLISALKQDRQRYEEAYRRGYAAGKDSIVRCKDCVHYNPALNYCSYHESSFSGGYYCGSSLKREETADE